MNEKKKVKENLRALQREEIIVKTGLEIYLVRFSIIQKQRSKYIYFFSLLKPHQNVSKGIKTVKSTTERMVEETLLA